MQHSCKGSCCVCSTGKAEDTNFVSLSVWNVRLAWKRLMNTQRRTILHKERIAVCGLLVSIGVWRSDGKSISPLTWLGRFHASIWSKTRDRPFETGIENKGSVYVPIPAYLCNQLEHWIHDVKALLDNKQAALHYRLSLMWLEIALHSNSCNRCQRVLNLALNARTHITIKLVTGTVKAQYECPSVR